MAQRYAAQAVAGAVMALRSSATQVGAWSARPIGSLITSLPSTSSSANLPVGCSLSPGRTMSAMPSSLNPMSWFDYNKVCYPDVYDAQEAMLCKAFKAHGSVVESYQPPKPYTHWFLPADPELDRKLKYFYSRLHTHFVCFRSLYGYRPSELQTRIVDAYKAVNGALAAGNVNAVEPYVTDQMLMRLTGEMARRQQTRVDWQLTHALEPKDVQLVHGVLIQNPAKQGKLHFVQWTARVTSRQVVAVYDKRGKLLAGDPSKELEVVDYWVFERPILKGWLPLRAGPQGAEWRLTERLSL